MMNELNLFCFITNLFIIVFCGVLMIIIPTLTRKTLLFGVRIPESEQNHSEIKAMKNNYITIILSGTGIIFLLAIAQYMFFPDLSLIGCLYFPMAIVALQMIAFILHWKKALKLKETNNWQVIQSSFAETRSSHSRGNLSDVPWLYYILAAVVIFASVAVALIKYPSLPDPLPTHFDINMNPDAWSEKSIGVVLTMPLINLGTMIVLAVSTIFIIKAKLQINMQNPALSFAQHRAYRRIMGHCFGIMALGMVIGMAYAGMMTLYPEQLRIPFGLFTAVLLLPCVPIIVMGIRVGQGGCKLNPKITETDALATGYRPQNIEIKSNNIHGRGDDKYWKLGLFYYNPDDPAVLVEDRFGTNIGFNYASIGGKIAVAILALTVIVLYVWITVALFPTI